MPPRPPALRIGGISDAHSPPCAAVAGKPATDSLEAKPDGSYALLGRSARGAYVFGSEGLIVSAGPDLKVAEKDVLFLRPLGAGACATVHKGFHTGLSRFVAVKRVNTAHKELRHQALRDIKILCDAQQVPGLLSMLGAYLMPARDQLAVVLEYMDGGTLAGLVAKLGPLPEGAVAAIAAMLLQGLAFMHSRHMVHRDIKPSNILLNLSGDAKLADFGISSVAEHTLQQCHTYAGTVSYMSPERLENKPYSHTADIWSLGLVLLECLTGRYPYAHAAHGGPLDLIIHVLQDDAPLPPPGGVSGPCRDFLAQCLARDPGRRPAASALLAHPWLACGAACDLRSLLRAAVACPDDRWEQVVYMFAATYYGGLSSGSIYPSLYLQDSVLSHQGEVHRGSTAIVARLQQLAAPCDDARRPVWGMASLDWQQLPGGTTAQAQAGALLVLVHGSVRAPGAGSDACGGTRSGEQQQQHRAPAPAPRWAQPEAHAQQARAAAGGYAFAESFLLAQTVSGSYYVANQSFRLL